MRRFMPPAADDIPNVVDVLLDGPATAATRVPGAEVAVGHNTDKAFLLRDL